MTEFGIGGFIISKLGREKLMIINVYITLGPPDLEPMCGLKFLPSLYLFVFFITIT